MDLGVKSFVPTRVNATLYLVRSLVLTKDVIDEIVAPGRGMASAWVK